MAIALMNPFAYDDVELQTAASKLVSNWDGIPGSLQHIRTGESSVFRFRARDEQHYFLRVTHPNHRDRTLILAESDFLDYLQQAGLPVVAPLAAADGSRVHDLMVGERSYGAVVFREAPGRHVKFFSADLDERFIRTWGETMARVHVAGYGFSPAGARRRYVWKDDYVLETGLALSNDSEPAAAETIRTVIAESGADGSQPQAYGLIHGDMGLSNMLLDGDTIRPIDFDDCCYHYFIADIAYALWPFRKAERQERSRFLFWFLQGYEGVRPLNTEEREAFPRWIKYRSAFLVLNFVFRTWHEQTHLTPGQSAWLEESRAFLAEPFVW